MAAVDDFVNWAKAQSPGIILKKLETSSFSGKSLSGAVQAANDISSESVSDQLTQTKREWAIAAKALYSTGVLAPAGLAVSIAASLPNDVLKAFGQANYAFSTLNFNGPSVKCSAASGAGLSTPAQLHGDYVAPRSLASLVIPVLTKAFFDIEQCWELVPGSMSWAAIASNIAIASIANMWNGISYGNRIDYFVPYVPSSGLAYTTAANGITAAVKIVDPLTQGWGGWNGKGLRNSDMGPWAEPPPFVVAGQAKYAFWPLSMVPKDVADPATEYPNVDRGVWNGDQSWQQPGWKWSRLSANEGPLLTVTEQVLGTTAKVAVGASALAVAAPFLAKWITGKSIEALIAEILP